MNFKLFLFFSVATKDCKTMQRYESKCPWLYSRLTRWLNALERRLFSTTSFTKDQLTSEDLFSWLQFLKKRISQIRGYLSNLFISKKLMVSKFQKQIYLFSFEPNTKWNISALYGSILRAELFRWVFGWNEYRTICFRNLLTFRANRQEKRSSEIYWSLTPQQQRTKRVEEHQSKKKKKKRKSGVETIKRIAKGTIFSFPPTHSTPHPTY